MGSRGRKSSAELAADGARSAVVRTERPTPPPELTGEYAREWMDIVDQLPAESIGREKQALLVAYCRCTVEAKHIAQIIDRLKEDFTEDGQLDMERYDTALGMLNREHRQLMSLSVRLGFGNDTSRKKREGFAGRKPWNFQSPARSPRSRKTTKNREEEAPPCA